MSHQPPTPVLPPILARLLDSLANQILSIDNQITTLRNGQITDGANTIRLTLADIQKRSEVIRGQLKTLVTGIAVGWIHPLYSAILRHTYINYYGCIKYVGS